MREDIVLNNFFYVGQYNEEKPQWSIGPHVTILGLKKL